MSKLSRLFNAIYKYLIAALIVFIPLYPKFPFINIPGTFVAIRLEDFLIGLLAVVVVVDFIWQKWSLKNPVVRTIALFLAVGLVSVGYGHFVLKTIDLNLSFLHWARRVEYFIPFFAALYATHTKRDLDFYLKLLCIVVGYVFIYGMGQKYLNWPVIVTQNEEYSKGVALRYLPGGHLNSTFAGHYDMSSFMVFLVPVLAAFFTGDLFDKNKPLGKAVVFVAMIAGMWLVSLSGSRISFFTLYFAITTTLVILKKYKYLPLFVVLGIIFLVSSTNLKARYQRIFDVLEGKTSALFVTPVYAAGVPAKIEQTGELTPTPMPIFEDRSTSIRLNVEWPRALRSLYKSPLTGTGYSSITLATDNDYLRALGETGILGLIAFLSLFVVLLGYCIGFVRNMDKFDGLEKGYLAGFVGGFVAILINATFIDIFEASKFAIIFWLFAGIMVNIVGNKLYAKKN